MPPVDENGLSSSLDYQSGADASAAEAAEMRRSLKTWTILAAVWAVGVTVWVVYLGVLGYVVLRLIA